MTTPNKGYATIVTGTRSGLWGDDLNASVFAIVDSNVGGIVTKSVAGSNITLTSTEAQNCIIRLTGSQSADIQVTNPCIGFYFVENLTTNSFNITVTNGVSGVVVPKGRSTIIADATNGCRIAGTDSFPTGTPMIFKQTSAPTGWTKIITDNNKAIRVVSGAVSSGGTLDFTTCFSSSRMTAGSTGSTALTISQIPAHTHGYSEAVGGFFSSGGGTLYRNANYPSSFNYTSSSVGGGAGHTHDSGTISLQMDVQYVDVIVAAKN